jgi:hypothetical protein
MVGFPGIVTGDPVTVELDAELPEGLVATTLML